MKYLLAVLCSLALAVSAQAAEVNFQWGQSTGQVDGYRIMWGDTMGGPYDSTLCDVNATTLSYTAVLNDNQVYYLVVKAYNQYGESGPSNELYWDYELPGAPGTFDMGLSIPDLLSSIGADEALIKFTARNMQNKECD